MAGTNAKFNVQNTRYPFQPWIDIRLGVIITVTKFHSQCEDVMAAFLLGRWRGAISALEEELASDRLVYQSALHSPYGSKSLDRY